MTAAATRPRHASGFTLVELLVVIGIITILISVLMPALARARSSANLVRCQSNFRQIHNALSLYVNENKGVLPRSSSLNPGPMGTFCQTLIRLTELLGQKFEDERYDSLSPVFTCVEADTSGGVVVWAPNLVRTIQFNPRAFPGKEQMSTPLLLAEYPQRKLSSIKNASDKIAFYEGAQLFTWNLCPEPSSIYLDGWRWSWGHLYADPPADGDMTRWNDPIDTGLNRDGTIWWECSMRFRHMRNTVTPVAFFDGHVESRRLGDLKVGNRRLSDVKVREICINR
jgi:prepilin-type N-terminal cleavage/methylation domain-containing protein/prepilin-type processing-associated H-X9-DG protein